MNNHSIQGGMKVGEWISEEGLEVENAFLWPYQTQIADDIVESGNVDSVVCVTPERRLHLGEHQDKITIGFIESHQYPGEGFDFEYGWAIAEDTRNALEPQIRPEKNLHQYEYLDLEERDLALDRAFSRIVSTTYRLLKDENSTVVYSMDSVGRYELPELAEEPVDNQLEYARRISEHLKEQSFKTELLYNPERSKDVYLSGRR